MNSGQQKLPDQCLHEAAEWYWTIRDADVSDETIVEWQLWLSASPNHKRAFDKIELALAAVDGIESPSWPTGEEIVADQYDGSISVREWQAAVSRSDTGAEPAKSSHGPIRNYSRTWAIAASLILIVMVGAIFQYRPEPVSDAQPDYALYQTGPAEHREVVLPDGSKIALGGKSTISVAYKKDERIVVLQRGEAYFDVTKDESRPFIVEARGREIIAVGTAFNVSRQDARVIVTVTEGTVIVAPDSGRVTSQVGLIDPSTGSQPVETARLEVGQMLVYDDDVVLPISVADPGDAVSWRNGLLKYRGEKLRFVIEDVERYIEYPIILTDSAVGELKYTGTVFQDSADTWVYGLEDAFSLVISNSESAVVIGMKTNMDKPN